MDIETLLRETLADQAFDAPQADDDFIPRALAERSARGRRAAATGGAVAAVAIVVAVATTTATIGGRDGVASPASPAGPEIPEFDPVLPAPPPEQQQAELATYLGIEDPPAVDVIRLVTPGQAQRLRDNCMVEAGWGDGTVNDSISVDVVTGETSTRSNGGGYSFPSDQEYAHDLASYICMASYPIDPAYAEYSDDPYVRSSLIEAAGPGQRPPAYRFAAIAALLDSSTSTARVVPSVAWVNDGDFLAVTTVGSSSCPTGPVTWTTGNNELAIDTGELRPGAGNCTTDNSPYTTIFEIPTGINPAVDLTIRVDGVEATLPGLP